MVQPKPAVCTTLSSASVTSKTALLAPQFDATQALNSGELIVTVSELLGCDYVFIQHPAKTLLMHDRHLVNTFNQLINMLFRTPKQKHFIGAHEDAQHEMRFYRFTCEWQGTQVTSITRALITNNEQYDFTKMIFDCSSPFPQPEL